MKKLTYLWLRFRYNLLMFLRGVFFVTGKIPFILVMLLFGFFAFVINDQGKDMMIAFGVDSFNQGIGIYLFLFIAYLFIWASIIWYVARIVLHSANLKNILDKPLNSGLYTIQGAELPQHILMARLDIPYKNFIENLAVWIPRILAMFPYLIFLAGFINVAEMNPGNIGVVLLVFAVAVVHFIYLYRRKKIVETINTMQKNKAADLMQNRFTLDAERSLRKIIKIHRLRIISILLLIAAAGAFIYSLAIARFVTPGLQGKPGLIIISALIFYSYLGLFINYASNQLKFPLLLVLIVLAIIFCLPRNNNHGLVAFNTPQSKQMAAQRMMDTAYFMEWLNYRLQDTSRYFTNGRTIPVFIIAAEGGGIRACYWTSNVLKQLHLDFEKSFPQLAGGFYKNTFAVTGASGGTIGLGFFYNYIYQNLNTRGNFAFGDSNSYAQLDTITGSDFLSGVTYAFAFPDMLQRFVPFKVELWDRGRFLGNSFSRSFYRHSHATADHSLLDDPYLNTWANEQTRYQYPALLFNSLYVEQGQKAIFSPFKLNDFHYHDVLDVIDTIRMSPAIKETMVSSARFPIITPPGLMQRDTSHEEGETKWLQIGHLVDGGYFENTAVQTAQQTALMVLRASRRVPLLSQKNLHIQPIIISIVYGGPLHGKEDALKRSYELAPVSAAMKTLFRWYDGSREGVIQLDTTSSLAPTYFRLYNKTLMRELKKDSLIFKPPLGWYLSQTSRIVIREQVLDTPYRRSRNQLFNRINK